MSFSTLPLRIIGVMLSPLVLLLIIIDSITRADYRTINQSILSPHSCSLKNIRYSIISESTSNE